MSLVGKFLRSFFPPSAPPAAPAGQEHEKTDRTLVKLLGIAREEQKIQTVRELRTLRADARYAAPRRLEPHGYKVWSQSDEDGILAEIFRRIGVVRPGQPGSFVEFGVDDGRECNTLKLLVEGWRGLWMEADSAKCDRIRSSFAAPLADGRLELLQTRVTAENIDGLIAGSRIAAAGELDLLSIDIDGNDYHVLKAIRGVRPRVLVIEYNAKFPPPMDLVQPYDPSHQWDGSDYFGASLQALANLAARGGYRLVGTNLAGVNAFFVRAELAGDRFADENVALLYNPPRYWLVAAYPSGHPPGQQFDYTSDAELARRGQE
jgi:hypothetical protein